MLGGGEGKIHFHPENWAQPVPTSAPLARAQPCSLCRGAQPPPNMAMLWPWFPRCRLARVPGGRRSREPCGEVRGSPYPAGAREGRRLRSTAASDGLVAATSHPGLPARPSSSGGGREGGRAPCSAPGFGGAVNSNGELEVPHSPPT